MLSMNMNIMLNNNLDKSLHMQVFAAIKEQILSGELKANEPLPSIHALARALHISITTTKKAYMELEKQQLIHTIDDQASFVTDNSQKRYQEDQWAKIQASLKQAISLAKTYNLPLEQLHNELDHYYYEP